MIRFCLEGGIDVEANWSLNKEIHVPVGASLDEPELAAVRREPLSRVSLTIDTDPAMLISLVLSN